MAATEKEAPADLTEFERVLKNLANMPPTPHKPAAKGREPKPAPKKE